MIRKLNALAGLIGFMSLGLSGCAKPGQVITSSVPRPPSIFQGKSPGSVLLFDGESSWDAEVDSLAHLLYLHDTSYREVDSTQLGAMTLDGISAFSLLIVPGGYAPTITDSLTKDTHARLRQAVQERGLSYLGFCAGAWLAVAPAPSSAGQDVSYGIGLVDGPLLQPNYLTQQGKEFAIVSAELPNISDPAAEPIRRDLLWYGGPITPDTPSGVIAKYPDGTPAISEIHSGKGFVIISGLHPTATQPILEVLGLSDPQAIAPDFAWELLKSAMTQMPLPTFSN
jgi:glutamine amidotransferase-like uncharacterized protein